MTTTVPAGPFQDEPLDLWATLVLDPGNRPAKDVRADAVAWLLAALDDAGVEVGRWDREVAGLLTAEAGLPAVQVVYGWLTRARAHSADQQPISRAAR